MAGPADFFWLDGWGASSPSPPPPVAVKTERARHTSFTAAGVPVLTRLPDENCADALLDIVAQRHLRTTEALGIPVGAWAWICCDAVCTDAEVNAGTCYVESACFPHGPGPGISRELEIYAFDVHSCRSARGQRTKLVYSDVDRKWYGSITLRGGTLDIAFECLGAGVFRLSWTGCDAGHLDEPYDCLDPLQVIFPNIHFPGCCDCREASPPDTDSPAEITFYVRGNCRRTLWARHVSFTADGKPVVAKSRPCAFDQIDSCACGQTMTCPVVATVTNVSACGCMAGTYDMSYGGGQWSYAGGWAGCADDGGINASCVPRPGGLVRIEVNVTCGTSGTGSGFSADFDPCDLENLDVTIPVTMSDPAACSCVGNCNWQWNAMAATWQQLADTCTCNGAGRPNSCDDCPNQPAHPPSSPTDGQLWSEPCTGGTPVNCCNGQISIRIMR